eukprot:COSAG01_NODE_47711_length_387_cov_6.454861_1_plen_109_part_10
MSAQKLLRLPPASALAASATRTQKYTRQAGEHVSTTKLPQRKTQGTGAAEEARGSTGPLRTFSSAHSVSRARTSACCRRRASAMRSFSASSRAARSLATAAAFSTASRR